MTEQATWTFTTAELRDLLADAHSTGAYAMTNGKWGVPHDEEGEAYADQRIAGLERSVQR